MKTYVLKLLEDLKKHDIGNRAFEIAILLELIVMMTDHYSMWTIPYRGRITHIAFCLFLIKIIFTKYSRNEYIVWSLLTFAGVISYATCKEEYVIRCVAMVMAAKAIDINKILKMIFVGSIIGTAIIILSSILGFGGPIVDIRHYGRGVEEARYCLGFNHANNVHDMLWYVATLYFLLKKGEVSKYVYLLLTGINIGLYLLTLSRTGLLVTQLVILASACAKYCHIFKKKWLWMTAALIELGTVCFFTIYSSFYNIVLSRMIAVVDRYLNGRLEMVFEKAGRWTWEFLPSSRSVDGVDNGFAFIMYVYGIFIVMILVVILVYLIFKLSKNVSPNYIILLMGAILVLFMEESFVINVSLLCNVILIICICEKNDANIL